jgi:hypothetical protein
MLQHNQAGMRDQAISRREEAGRPVNSRDMIDGAARVARLIAELIQQANRTSTIHIKEAPHDHNRDSSR